MGRVLEAASSLLIAQKADEVWWNQFGTLCKRSWLWASEDWPLEQLDERNDSAPVWSLKDIIAMCEGS